MSRTTALLLLLFGFSLGACAPQSIAVTHPHPALDSVPVTVAAPGSATAGASSYPGCYYTWATRELPELSLRVDSVVRSIQSNAAGAAYAFGEDCTPADGTHSFSAMETDFRTTFPVSDLQDQEALGNLMADTLRALDALPQADLPGTHPGRVEFVFEGGAAGSLRLNVEIARYRAEALGITGVQLFRLFYPAP